jgi:hypothetical protein
VLLRLAGAETSLPLGGSTAPAPLAIRSHFPVPNPVDPDRGGVRIVAELSRPAQWARLTVFDLSGRTIFAGTQEGLGTDPTVIFRWDGRDRRGDRLANGTYLYRLEVGAQEATARSADMGRIVLMR